MSNKYRRSKNRCEDTLRVRRSGKTKIDSWRCSLVLGHAGDHVSMSGHRHWPQQTPPRVKVFLGRVS